ncbi:MAG TPA: hypothetical protein VGI74_11395 [Streptosporangiaceae bacterium]
MDLTADSLVEALLTCSGEPADGPAEIVALVRKAQPSFAATLFSAWRAGGDELSPALRDEIAAARARVEYYRAVAAGLMAAVDGLTTIKGLEVAALYPPGLVRYMNDLDFIASSETALWRAVGFLTGDGWELDTGTFSCWGGALQVLVSLRRSHEDRYQLPYGIELATYYTLGNQGGIPPVLRLPEQWRVPAVKNMLMLLHERYEQPFRARDLLDAALLNDALRGTEPDALHEAVVTLGLAVEYAELVRLTTKAGIGSLRELPGGQWTMARVRAHRLARGAGFFTRPLAGTGRHLQRRLMMGNPSRAEGMVWDAVQRRLQVATAVPAGLLAFGLPLEGPRPEVSTAVLRRRGKLAWADTPAGRFLLTIGDEVSEEAVEELSTPEGGTGGPSHSQRAQAEDQAEQVAGHGS